MCCVHMKHNKMYCTVSLCVSMCVPKCETLVWIVLKCHSFVSTAACVRHALIFRKCVSRKSAGKGKALLECLGLSPDEIKFCYQSNPLNEEQSIQDGLIKWWETHGNHCTWQVLLSAMHFAGIAQQHCTELVEELHQMMQGEVTLLLYTMPACLCWMC